jgi:predicted DNA-binding transcriptional regulator YafY
MRADRLLSILMLLQARGRMTARDLAERLEVSERTIYRDVDALGVAGVPIVVERGRLGGCSLLDGYHTDLTGLTATEARTLFVARAVSHLADLGLDAAGDTALPKLLAALPAAYRPAAERALERMHLDAEIWFQAAEPTPYLAVAHDAVWQDRRLQLTYRHGDGRITADVMEPLGLVAKARVWYLVAHMQEGAFRVFRVSRIQEAVLLDEHFARPAGFDLRVYWAAWCAAFERSIPRYPVIIRVAPEAMPRLQALLGEEVDLHLEQATPADAAGWRTVPVAFERVDDARRALLGCGALMEVIAPWELRESILQAAESLIALYRRSGAVDLPGSLVLAADTGR